MAKTKKAAKTASGKPKLKRGSVTNAKGEKTAKANAKAVMAGFEKTKKAATDEKLTDHQKFFKKHGHWPPAEGWEKRYDAKTGLRKEDC